MFRDEPSVATGSTGTRHHNVREGGETTGDEKERKGKKKRERKGNSGHSRGAELGRGHSSQDEKKSDEHLSQEAKN